MEPARDSQHALSMLECLNRAGHEPASSQAASVFTTQDDVNAIASPEDSQTHSNGGIRSDVSEGVDTGFQTLDTITDEEAISKEVVERYLAEEPKVKTMLRVAIAVTGKDRFPKAVSEIVDVLCTSVGWKGGSKTEELFFKLLKSEGGSRKVKEALTAQSDRLLEEIENIGENGLIDQLQQVAHEVEQEAIQRRIEDALLSLPEELRYTLQSVPKKDFRLSQEQDTSIWNQFKGWVEDSTQQRWDWWPMTARKRMLEPGESRLLWQTNGKEHWEELSSKQREAVEILLALLDDVPKSLPRCVGEPTTTSRSIMKFGTAGVMIAGAASLIYWLM